MEKFKNSDMNIWRLIAKSLGEKSGNNDKESDKIAFVRLIIVSMNFLTCLFIIAGIIRHW